MKGKGTGAQNVQGEQRFRRWLTDRIKDTRFAIFDGYDVEQLAKRLGVQPEVLRAAQLEKAKELLGIGRKYVGKKRTHSRASVEMCIWHPEIVAEDLKERARRMEMGSCEVVRAIAHTLLSGPDNPVVLERYWWYHGDRYIWSSKNRSIFVTMSNGARTALDIRAKRLGTTATCLMRGAIADYLEYRLNELYFLTALQMWEDPNRYWTGDLIRKGEYVGHSRNAQP